MNKYIGLLAFVALAWWWTSSEALTPTSRFGIRYAPGDTLVVSGTARVDSLDSLLVGGRIVGTMLWQDTTHVDIDTLSATGPVYIGDSADSANGEQLSIQSGVAFSRLSAGDETFEISSDEQGKEGFTEIDLVEVRRALLALPAPQQWHYKHDASNRHTGWTAQELYSLSVAVRPETASPTSVRLTDRIIGLVVTTQAQQDQIDDLQAAVYDEELGGVPLVTYVLGLAALVAALSGYVATLKKQVNGLEARIANLEGVAPNPPNPTETEK